MKTLSLLAFALCVLLGSMPAWATDRIVKFCAEYQVDYEDSDLGLSDPAAEGDYFATNSNKVARGARIRIIRQSNSDTAQEYADWDGADAGCASFTMVVGQQYDVQIRAVASVRDNTIQVMDHQDSGSIWYSVALNDWTVPSGAGVLTQDIETANTHAAWNVAAAAGHAMWRRGGGFSGVTYDFYTQYDDCDTPSETSNPPTDECDPCGNNSGSCSRDGAAHLSTEGVNRRIIIVHEMGHSLAYFAAGSYSPPSDYDLDPGAPDCYSLFDDGDSHEMNGKEWQSAAIKEGWAHFYAAVAFNQTNETDCGFIYYKSQNYDLVGGNEAGDPHPFSCEAGPSFTTSGIGAKNYLEEKCTGDLDDKGTEMDWLRFWWDLLTEESATVSFDDCTEIYAWSVSPLLYGEWEETPDQYTNYEDRPYGRMETVADDLGFASEWAAHIDNGIDR